jgi:4-carboxymuconolactone decarboxylase
MRQPIKSVPLPDVNTLPQNERELLERLPQLNVFKMLTNLPNSLIPFIEFTKSFLNDKVVDLRLLEIGILRVAHLTNSPYEWHQHELLAKSTGIGEKEINIIRTESVVNSLSSERNFICKISDELTTTSNLSDEVFGKLFMNYSIQQGMAIILCMSFYNMLARILNATRVQIETENPLAGKSSPVND